jgi:signal transduction histidine kinase/ActR/RegA family two-component response regulator
MTAPKAELLASIETLLTQSYAVRTTDLAGSVRMAEEALALAEGIGEQKWIAKSLAQLSFYQMIQSEFDLARKTAEKAIRLFEAIPDDRGVADVKFTIASVYYKTDNFHSGLKYLLDCLTVYRKYEDFHNLSRTQKSIGAIYEYYNDIEKAIVAYQDAIIAAQKIGDKNMESNVYNPLSGIKLNQGFLNEALAMIEQSIALKKATNDVRGMGFALYGRGKIYTAQNKFDEAEKDLFESLSIHQKMGEKLGESMTFSKIGALYLKKQAYDLAIENLNQALEISRNKHILFVRDKSQYMMFETYKAKNDWPMALHWLEKYQQDKQATTDQQLQKMISSYDLLMEMESTMMAQKMERERAEMTEKREKAEQLAKAKQNFLSTMSHEIRTPLNAIITITHLLREKPDPEENQLLDSLKFASNNLLYLINDILDFSKLDSGKVSLENRSTNIRNLLDNIRNTYDGLAKEKGVNLTLNIDSLIDDYYLFDATKFAQIMGNLISNGIKFTDAGKVAIYATKGEGNTINKDLLRFSVVDTGQGIEADFLADIFESFTQQKEVTVKAKNGSGLGLAIVKKLAELFGTEVKIETAINKGSTFYFDVCLEKMAMPAIDSTTKSKTPELTNLNVLLAEDNKINTLVATKLLNKWGVKVSHAENGQVAVKMASVNKYDFILMDIHMPEMNGYDAAAAIKAMNGVNASTPIYALTADINAAQLEAYKASFDDFLRKPIELEQLHAALSKFVA